MQSFVKQLMDPANLDIIVAGYHAGRHLKADLNEKNPVYWYGYRNGIADGGHAVPHPDHVRLVQKVIRASEWRKESGVS